MSGGPERMGKQPTEQRRQPEQSTLEKEGAGLSAAFFIVLAASAIGIAFVASSGENCSDSSICHFLGFTYRAEAIRFIVIACVSVEAFITVVAFIFDAKTAANSVETAAKSVETAAKSAETAAKSAETAAKSAETAAKSAKTAANSVETAAKSAKTAANSVETAAKSVETAAKSAETAAKSAETAAKSAETAANSAKTAANSVETAANSVETAANSAKTAANSAKTAANSAKTAANSAKTAANSVEAANRQRAFKDEKQQLKSKEASVRQESADALFHLAMEDEELRAPIVGVLCAYIRETTVKGDYQKEYGNKPSAEIESVLRRLFTTKAMKMEVLENFWHGITPDLEGGYFRGAELENAWFQGAKLNSAQFHGATLEKAQFQEASLQQAQFQGASLWSAIFEKASLQQAQFQGALLEKAQFQEASLQRTQFQGAWLWMADFQQAKFDKDSEYEGNPAQEHTVTKPDEMVEKFKADAFYGICSECKHESRVLPSFEERINDRIDKESDFSGVIFSVGVTKKQLGEVGKTPGPTHQNYDDLEFKDRRKLGIAPETGQPEGNKLPKGVIAGSYSEEDAALWIREFREEKATQTSQPK